MCGGGIGVGCGRRDAGHVAHMDDGSVSDGQRCNYLVGDGFPGDGEAVAVTGPEVGRGDWQAETSLDYLTGEDTECVGAGEAGEGAPRPWGAAPCRHPRHSHAIYIERDTHSCT